MHHDGMVEILARCGATSDMIVRVLRHHLEAQPARAAGLISDYGDKQFLPILTQMFDETDLSDHEMTVGNTRVKEFGETILALGGDLNESQRLKLNMATAMLKHQQRALTFDYWNEK